VPQPDVTAVRHAASPRAALQTQDVSGVKFGRLRKFRQRRVGRGRLCLRQARSVEHDKNAERPAVYSHFAEARHDPLPSWAAKVVIPNLAQLQLAGSRSL
jgi:hypothetical protein